MHWPGGTGLIAADRSRAMIRSLWPGDVLGYPAVCAEWTALPLPDRSQDIVIGDGSFNAMPDPSEHRALAATIGRTLRPGGLLLLRFFLRPDRAEPVATVIDDVWQGRIGNFHVFKWRLAHALHTDPSAGVRLSDIWDAWRAAVPDSRALAQRLGWPLAVLATIDNYRGSNTRYTFPTLDEARGLFDQRFSEELCAFPRYELGERCPTLGYRFR
jgi:SAM-dependent methyltransferase